MSEGNNQTSNYSKRPMWQWVLIYLIIGGIIYGLIAYFVVAHKGGSGGAQHTSTISVEYNAQGFNPKSVTIKAGDTVTWTNKDEDQLWVGSNPHPTHTDYPGFDALKGIATGGTYSFTFTRMGTWGYHNHLKPEETGKIIVQ